MAKKLGKQYAQEIILEEIDRSWAYENAMRYRGLSVVEIYTSHWGPAQCVFPSLQEIYAKYHQLDRPIKLLCVACDNVDGLEEHRGKSMCTFLICKRGQVLGTVNGVDMPALTALIDEHAPSKDALAAEEDLPFVDEELYNKTKEEAAKAAKGGKKGTKGKAGDDNKSKRRPSLSSGLGRRRSIQKGGRS